MEDNAAMNQGGSGLEMIQEHGNYCALYFYYY